MCTRTVAPYSVSACAPAGSCKIIHSSFQGVALGWLEHSGDIDCVTVLAQPILYFLDIFACKTKRLAPGGLYHHAGYRGIVAWRDIRGVLYVDRSEDQSPGSGLRSALRIACATSVSNYHVPT